MIREIFLENIRLFSFPGVKFSLPNLSIFCGTNSSGKSTVLKTLLLLRQTEGIEESSGSAQGGTLRLVGSQVDLGDFSSFVANGDTKKKITVSVTIEDTIPSSFFLFLKSLDSSGESEKEQEDSEQESILYLFKSSFVFESSQNRLKIKNQSSSKDSLQENENIESSTHGVLLSAEYELSVRDEKLLCWKIELPQDKEKGRPNYDLLIQKDYFLKWEKKHNFPKEMVILEESECGNFVKAATVLDGLIPDRMIMKYSPPKAEELSNNLEETKWVIFPMPDHMMEALKDLSRALHQIHYLSPLRTPAKRYYITNLDTIPNPDPAGEFLPYILRLHEGPKVWNARPSQDNAVQEGLISALNGWLYYLRVGAEPPEGEPCEEIEVTAIKNILVELQIKTVAGRRKFPLADSGFGYSQVLPILVRGLLAPKNSTLIVEQPELHLNPALQVRLARFFVAMARTKKQIIIETHSEHIVNAIRVFAAEDESGVISANSAIFFVNALTEVPLIHELTVRPDGTVPEWPHDFFGEAVTLSGRLLRAQKRYRKKDL